jgi:ABC-type lipoprotein release transport system permease subunit
VSVPVTRVLADLVVGVTPLDSLTLVASAAALAALAGLVSWLAARDAARVNPVETLASE